MKILHTIQHGPFTRQPNNFFIPEAQNTLKIIGGTGDHGIQQSTILTLTFYKLVTSHDIWIIHRYYNEYGPIIRLAHKKTKIIIQTWGKDYLVHRNNPDMFLPHTRRSIGTEVLPNGFSASESHNTKTSSIRLPKTKLKIRYPFKPCFHLAHKVLFCTPQENLDGISSDQHGKLCRFLYGVVPNIEEPKAQLREILKIQVGHNANQFNNHIDVLNHFRDYRNKHHLFLPLSYGGTSDYIAQIDNIVHNSASIQRTNLPYDQYIEQLRSVDTYCSFAIRQTGLGNLWTHIFLGHSILLHSTGIQAKLLQYAGLQFLNETDIKKGSLSMPIDVRESNQKKGLAFFKRIRNETNQLIEHLQNNVSNALQQP